MHQALVDLMIPIVVPTGAPKWGLKSLRWAYRCTAAWASLRNGAAQYYRDSRISRFTKALLLACCRPTILSDARSGEAGQTMPALIAEMEKTAVALGSSEDAALRSIGGALTD